MKPKKMKLVSIIKSKYIKIKTLNKGKYVKLKIKAPEPLTEKEREYLKIIDNSNFFYSTSNISSIYNVKENQYPTFRFTDELKRRLLESIEERDRKIVKMKMKKNYLVVEMKHSWKSNCNRGFIFKR